MGGAARGDARRERSGDKAAKRPMLAVFLWGAVFFTRALGGLDAAVARLFWSERA